MARTRRRSSASASVSQSAIETTRSTLNELEMKPKESLSLREAIGELHESITDALNRGYSYEEVVEILASQGVTITVASLKRYLAAARKEVADKPRRTRRISNRSRKTQLAKQSEALSSASASAETDLGSASSTSTEVEEPTKKRRTTSRSKSASATTSRTRPAARTKTAAKAKPTSRAKTTTARTSGRGRKRSSAAE